MKTHIFEPLIARVNHKITIHVIGVGGTGSAFLKELAITNRALVALGRQPLHVVAFDPDTVKGPNIVRQEFSEVDLHRSKAVVVIERINRFYGIRWKAVHDYYNWVPELIHPAIIISCVDSVASRKIVMDHYHSLKSCRYWMDIGNDVNYGQIILGAKTREKQQALPHFFEEYKDVKDTGNEGPSCSSAEAIARQDLFINRMMALYAASMLWDLMKNMVINYRGLYVNLEFMRVEKIPID